MHRFKVNILKYFFWKEKIIQQKFINLNYIIEGIFQQNKSKPKLLPPSETNKLSVVMQIDQFLSYTYIPDQQAYLLAPIRPYDHYHEFHEQNALLSIYKRKNLQNFINYLTTQCQPIIFSKGIQSYVQIMMQYIDPQHKIKHVFTQTHCNRIIIEKQQIDQFVKDLNLLGRDLSRVVYLDSTPLSNWLHPRNCIPVEPFIADNTMEGQDLNDFILDLEQLKQMKDVRDYLHKTYQLEDILKSSHLL